MTIIQPNRNKNFIRFLLPIFVLILVGGGLYIFEYNSFVDIRHERDLLRKDMIGMQSLNADLKDKFYEITDPVNLETLAADYKLVLEKKPKYLQ